VLIVIGKTIAVFALLLVVLMYIWFLRKVIAQMQNRVGPTAPARRAAPEPGRRHQALLQGAVGARTRPTGASSASRPTSRCCPRSSRSASCPSAAS
jgi:hypothetical protein